MIHPYCSLLNLVCYITRWVCTGRGYRTAVLKHKVSVILWPHVQCDKAKA